MKKIILSTLLLLSITFAQENNAEVDCLILEDENSIICKYLHTRVSFDKSVSFEWVDPEGNISRTRDMIIPAEHGSVYDFRYIQGRQKGIWTFRVIDGENTYKTEFEIK